MTFSELVAQHVGLGLKKQFALADFLGRHSWALDIETGVVDFGKTGFFGTRRVYPIQIVGTESDQSQTWLWGWANTASNIPTELLRSASELKAFGQSHGVTELQTPQLPAEQFPGHLLSLISSGICGADCYYRAPNQAGAVFFLIFETPLQDAPATPVERMCKVLIQAVSQFEVADHRAMATAYLRAEGFDLFESGESIEANALDGRALTVSFDADRRIARVAAQAR